MDSPVANAALVVLIPCLNEARTIGLLVREVQKLVHEVVVVDDGSNDSTAAEATRAGATVLVHERSRGKGAALATGFKHAWETGREWALTMDGDGQHAPADIPVLFQCARETNAALVVGNRLEHPAGMPWLRQIVNRWMSRRLSRLTGHDLPDTQCGFRLVNLAAWSALDLRTTHFEIESEMLVSFLGAGHRVEFVPIQVLYKGERSKIHPLRDSWRWFKWWQGTGRNGRG